MASPATKIDLSRLPRGPHRLSREEVERSQRERLLMATAEAVAEKGYAATSVADVSSRAGVSRTTFYQLFDDKLDCFLAANQMAAEVLSTTIVDALTDGAAHGGADPIDKLDRLLSAYLDTLAAFPVLARVFLVEVYAAGPEAIRQRRASLAVFVDLVSATLGGNGDGDDADPETRTIAEVLVAAVSSMVTNAVGVGEADHLPDLRRPLMLLAQQVLSTR